MTFSVPSPSSRPLLDFAGFFAFFCVCLFLSALLVSGDDSTERDLQEAHIDSISNFALVPIPSQDGRHADDCLLFENPWGSIKRKVCFSLPLVVLEDGPKVTHRAHNADFRRKPQTFLEIQAFGGRRNMQKTIDSRRKATISQKTEANRWLGSVTLGPSPQLKRSPIHLLFNCCQLQSDLVRHSCSQLLLSVSIVTSICIQCVCIPAWSDWCAWLVLSDLSIYLSIYLSISLHVSPSLSHSLALSLCICLSLSLSIWSLSLSLSLSVVLFCLPLLSQYLYISLSTYIYIYML